MLPMQMDAVVTEESIILLGNTLETYRHGQGQVKKPDPVCFIGHP